MRILFWIDLRLSKAMPKLKELLKKKIRHFHNLKLADMSVKRLLYGFASHSLTHSQLEFPQSVLRNTVRCLENRNSLPCLILYKYSGLKLQYAIVRNLEWFLQWCATQ